jgi:hypothetical protein
MQDLASTATTDIGAQNTNFLRITGNTTITSFGTQYRGPRFLVFEGAVTLTNSSTLVLPGGANITTAAGDVLIAIPGATLGTADKWIVTAYQKNTSVSNPNFDALQVAGNNISAAGGFSFKNRLINANPIINQRGYVSGAATSGSNQYTLDRWRVVVSGQNVSWTNSGLTRTVTCPAGGLEQVIESLNIEGGTFVLSWTGTATATVNGTAVVENGTFTLPANTNATVRFSSGTLSNPQLEAGTVATPFERRDYGRELAMCQRYLPVAAIPYNQYMYAGMAFSANSVQVFIPFSVPARSAPTGITAIGSPQFSQNIGTPNGSVVFGAGTVLGASLSGSGISGFAAGNATALVTTVLGGAQIFFNGCEL